MADYTSITPEKIRTMTEFNLLDGNGITEFNSVFNELEKHGYGHLSGPHQINRPNLKKLVKNKFITKEDYDAVDMLIDEVESIEKILAKQRADFIARASDTSEHLIPTLGISSVNLSINDVADYLDAGFIEEDEANLIVKVLNRKKIDITPSFSLRDLYLLHDRKFVSDDEFTEIKDIFGIIENHEWFLGNTDLTKDQIVLTKENLKVLNETGLINNEQFTTGLFQISFMPKFHQILRTIKKIKE